MRIEIPEKVNDIINRLQSGGYEAYAVGGCIRDSVLGRTPEDWDITTSAKPKEVKQLFDRTIDTGIEHGTVTVMLGREGFEVTTYRIDGEYEDHRHPREVVFTADLKEDLRRRDFTINAMAYNRKTGLVDEFGGLADLQSGQIRCVGDPEERFSEDALRMLRAVRFSAALGFEIEIRTREAVRKLCGNLRDVSAERIQTELVKLLTSERPDKWADVCGTGIADVILPEYLRYTPAAGQRAVLGSLLRMPAGTILRLSALLQYLTKQQTEEILKRLRFDNKTVRTVSQLVDEYKRVIVTDDISIRTWAARIGAELFELMLAGRAAVTDPDQADEVSRIGAMRASFEQIRARGDCISMDMLAVDGSDLLTAGMKPGRQMGEVLKELLRVVLAEPEKNDKEYLLTIVHERFYHTLA